jgi:hypothetical protein
MNAYEPAAAYHRSVRLLLQLILPANMNTWGLPEVQWSLPPEILGSIPGSVAAGLRPGGPWRTIGPVSSGLASSGTRAPGVRCFLRHIGAAGFRVGWALCQVAVRLGWVVFRRMGFLDLSSLPSPYGSCSDEIRL